MKRSHALRGLSREHHEALVLARRAANADADEAGQVRELLMARWAAQFEPHFAFEERELLPALDAAGHAEPADEARAQHAALRGLFEQVRAGHLAALEPWGAAMQTHVRFEERTLFPLAESALDLSKLVEAAARRPSSHPPPT